MRLRFATVLVAGALVLIGCGGGSSTSSPEITAGTSEPGEPDGAPSAVLVDAAGTELAVGQLGGYAVAGASESSPWLPGSPVTVATETQLSVSPTDGRAAENWTAAYVPAVDRTASPSALADGDGEIAFGAPPPGLWSVQVEVRYRGGGSAAFYWAVSVEQP